MDVRSKIQASYQAIGDTLKKVNTDDLNVFFESMLIEQSGFKCPPEYNHRFTIVSTIAGITAGFMNANPVALQQLMAFVYSRTDAISYEQATSIAALVGGRRADEVAMTLRTMMFCAREAMVIIAASTDTSMDKENTPKIWDQACTVIDVVIAFAMLANPVAKHGTS